MKTKKLWAIEVIKNNLNENNELDLSKVDSLQIEIALSYLTVEEIQEAFCDKK